MFIHDNLENAEKSSCQNNEEPLLDCPTSTTDVFTPLGSVIAKFIHPMCLLNGLPHFYVVAIILLDLDLRPAGG